MGKTWGTRADLGSRRKGSADGEKEAGSDHQQGTRGDDVGGRGKVRPWELWL